MRADTCTLCLQVSLNLFGSCLRFFIHHSNNPSLQSFIYFSLPSREVSYSAVGCILLDDIAHSGHRNIKISGIGIVALRLSTLFHNFGSQILLCSSFFSPCSVWYTQTNNTKVESTFLHFNWLQVWFLYYQHLLLATGEFKYKLKEHHMLEIQFWKGANNFVQSIFGVLCGMIADLAFFLRFFFVFPMQTKEINMWIPKHLQLQQFSWRSAAFSDHDHI